MSDLGDNRYAITTLNPLIKAKYPDEAASTSFLKSIQMAAEYKIEELTGFTRDYRFILKQGGQNLNCGVQRYDGTHWYHEHFIEPSETVENPAKYQKRRVVARMTTFRSSTIPIG